MRRRADQRGRLGHLRAAFAGAFAGLAVSLVLLLDEGSRNGTWLNGHRVSRSLLRDGDSIVLGARQLRYAENALILV